MRQGQLFFELLQTATGECAGLSRAPSGDDWEEIYSLCERHTLTGIGYAGIRRLPRGQWPPRALVLRWTAVAERTAMRNMWMNGCCGRMCRDFENNGFSACVLKGQSNLGNYPEVGLADGTAEELGDYRTPGDIDIWVRPQAGCGRPVRAVIGHICRICPGRTVYYHHVDYPAVRGTGIEVHYRPSFMYSPLRNMRLQEWFRENEGSRALEIHGDVIKVPGDGFNIVFQLAHIFKHLFEEGIGLRQVMDYYFVVRRAAEKNIMRDAGRNGMAALLRRLGLYKFAAAMMFVLHEVFRLDESEMIVPMDGKEGRFLLDEIMRAGNFGRYDDRIPERETRAQRAVRKLRRNFRFVRSYPEEVLCEPFFRVYHWLWRTLRLWRFE